jgi:hypothetical protein
MTFDIKEFLHRMEEGKPTSTEIARLVVEEIAKAERLKMGFVEEVEREPEFVSQTLRQISVYVLQLKDVQKWFPQPLFPEEILPIVDLEDRPMAQEKIAALLRDLEE